MNYYLITIYYTIISESLVNYEQIQFCNEIFTLRLVYILFNQVIIFRIKKELHE